MSYSSKSYIQNPHNIIDLLAVLPLPLRITMGIPLPSMEENLAVHVLLMGFVPFIRLLKMVRRFHKLEILLHVLSTTIDALSKSGLRSICFVWMLTWSWCGETNC